MNAMLFRTLVVRSLARAFPGFAAVTAILAGFQIIMVLVATTFQEARSFDTISSMFPSFLQRSMGPSVLSLASFQGIVTFGYFHPIAVLVLVQAAIYMATEPAAEVEWGMFDIQLSRPVARHWIVTRTLALSFGLTVATTGAMVCATWGALALLAPAGARWPAAARIVDLAAHLIMLSWVFAAAGVTAAAYARRRSAAFGVTALSAVFLYLLSVVSDVWPPASQFGVLSPFHYFPGVAAANGTAATAYDLQVLCLPVVAFAALAYWRFGRRDL
jgi:ABC-2 type transport system permease protein